jgi:hypothetical protein
LLRTKFAIRAASLQVRASPVARRAWLAVPPPARKWLHHMTENVATSGNLMIAALTMSL